ARPAAPPARRSPRGGWLRHRRRRGCGRRGGRDTRPALGVEAGPPAPVLRLPAGGCAARWQRIAPARSRLAEALAGVRRITVDGLAQWRYHGRLVARQLDDAHVVIRARTLGAISPTLAAPPELRAKDGAPQVAVVAAAGALGHCGQHPLHPGGTPDDAGHALHG